MSLYKYILNALPLLCQPIESHPFIPDDDEDIALDPPRPIGKRVRRLRLSASGRARHEWTKKRTKAWFSVVAGAVAGGVAIMFERSSRRVAIGQQMFVRSVKSTITLMSRVFTFPRLEGFRDHTMLWPLSTDLQFHTAQSGSSPSRVPRSCTAMFCGRTHLQGSTSLGLIKPVRSHQRVSP